MIVKNIILWSLQTLSIGLGYQTRLSVPLDNVHRVQFPNTFFCHGLTLSITYAPTLRFEEWYELTDNIEACLGQT